MSSKVKFCRNFVACLGIFIFMGGIFEIATTPAKWPDGLEMFGIAFMCLTIVREVNQREGNWHDEAFGKKRPTQSDPPA